MVTDAPAARGELSTAPQVHFAPSTKYATPMVTPAGVEPAPWFLMTLVKMLFAGLYESESGIRSGRVVGVLFLSKKAMYWRARGKN